MSITLSSVKALAEKFLVVADELNEGVTNYINGSNASKDIDAYERVKQADVAFTQAYNAYFTERNEACLNYELAESVI